MTSISELLNKKIQQVNDKRAAGKNTYTFKQPVTTIRILPGWRTDGDPTFFHDFGQTWIKDMDGKVVTVILDQKLTYGTDDPVRPLVQRAMGEARTDAQRAHFKEMLAKPRVLVNAQVLDDKNVSPDVAEIVEFSEAGFTNAIEQAALAGIADEFLDPNKGFDLIVSKKGKGFETKYTYTFARKPRAVPEAVLETRVDIDGYIRGKLGDSERAINAIKSLTVGAEVLSIENRATDYSGGADIIDGSFSAVDEAKTVTEEVEITKHTISEAEIDSLFE